MDSLCKMVQKVFDNTTKFEILDIIMDVIDKIFDLGLRGLQVTRFGHCDVWKEDFRNKDDLVEHMRTVH